MIAVRTETPVDRDAIRSVNSGAFGRPAEADLVDRLRADGDLLLSLVAGIGRAIVGHCAFSRLTVHNHADAIPAVALGPVAVLPEHQRRGVGQSMIRDGIDRLRQGGETLVFVLGDPGYYQRFGFDAGVAAAYRTPYDGPHMQVLRLSDDAPHRGEVRYAPAFAGL
ncbi:N-acetyltransferase [Pseudorhodoplanes sp.]|uniref:GNAT family N-acetyltransferase n=1 Tax=Pseudorhodoplanes sp. TaxID=1934341 RepID=UPI002D03A1B6|nr:N-acetyltransferase [Pseudorhodoplanes sp.]HWV41345.1 N-acetyltransferase [Pseudorhodoplanes sp.]